MQKISTYLYPNRIELLADLAAETYPPTEYTNVYQRNVKLYNGIDNTLEFDIKNSDQKRIDLSTLTQIELNIMDTQGNSLPNSPYTVAPMDQTTRKGLAFVTIPQEDLVELDNQFLQFSVSALKDGRDVMLYGDTRFGAVGKMELVGNAMPTFRNEVAITSFYSDMEYNTLATERFHSSAIPVRFYEAVPTTSFGLDFTFDNFEGTVTIELTKDASISSESFSTRGTVYMTFPISDPTTTSTTRTVNLDDNYCYLRVTYTRKFRTTGKITKVIIS